MQFTTTLNRCKAIKFYKMKKLSKMNKNGINWNGYGTEREQQVCIMKAGKKGNTEY
jgi:hypothetical protein